MGDMNARILAFSTVSLITVLTLTGCTSSVTHNHGDSSSSMMSPGSDSVLMSDPDIMFAQMMIPHHEQAVEMSTLAETRSQNADVLALAQQIKEAQAPEIALMTSWLTVAGAPLIMGHDMGDDGMLSADEMTALANSSGVEFDKLFLTGMIGHHEGAVTMAQSVAGSSNTDVKALSESIISSQTTEIEKMKQLFAALQ
jgi:uncharacterized protein (DUF305 family)